MRNLTLALAAMGAGIGCFTPVNLGMTGTSTGTSGGTSLGTTASTTGTLGGTTGSTTGGACVTGACTSDTDCCATIDGPCGPVNAGCISQMCVYSENDNPGCDTVGESSSGTSSGASGSTGESTSGAATAGEGTSGTSSSSGSISITVTTVDIHPAASAALLAANAPVPSLTTLSPAGGPYQIDIEGVSIGAGPVIEVTTLFSTPISNSGPYVFELSAEQLQTEAPLGLLLAINQSLPDGGVSLPTTSLPQLPCALLEDAGIAEALSEEQSRDGFADYFLPTIAQVGGREQPPASDISQSAYAVPMSYASLLNCAGQPNKTSRDSDLGVALIYATNGTTEAAGTPVSGASFNISGAINTPVMGYYADAYGSATAGPTDATGVATAVNIETGSVPPLLTASDAAGDAFFSPGISTSANTVFNAFVYLQ